MPWNYIEINEPAVLGGAYHRLCRQFQQAFIAASAPADMAMFVENAPSDTRRIYFSPGCVRYVSDLILDFGGCECDPPDVSSVILVYGTPEAFDELVAHEKAGGDGLDREAIVQLSGKTVRVNGTNGYVDRTTHRAPTGASTTP
jgi:hypothetical protein